MRSAARKRPHLRDVTQEEGEKREGWEVPLNRTDMLNPLEAWATGIAPERLLLIRATSNRQTFTPCPICKAKGDGGRAGLLGWG